MASTSAEYNPLYTASPVTPPPPMHPCKKNFYTLAEHSNQTGLLTCTFLANSINNAVKAIFEEIKDSANEVSTWFDHGIGVITSVSLVNSVKWWLYDKANSIHQTISMGFFTIMKIIRTATALGKFGVVNLSKIAITIGQIPVLSLVTQGLLILATTFSLLDNWKKYTRLADEQEIIKTRVNRRMDGMIRPIFENIPEFKANAALMAQLKKDMAAKVIVIAIAIITVIGMCAAIGFLGSTAPLLLSLSVMSSSISLYNYYGNRKLKDVKEGKFITINERLNGSVNQPEIELTQFRPKTK